MLKVKAFKISDDTGVNELLATYGLASGMHILVSEGNILVPYNDGAPKPKKVLAAELGEQVNILVEQREIIEHSEHVNDLQKADLGSLVDVYRAEVEAATANPVKKAAEQKLKEVESALEGVESQSRKNKFEVTRISTNIEYYEAQIAELKK